MVLIRFGENHSEWNKIVKKRARKKIRKFVEKRFIVLRVTWTKIHTNTIIANTMS